MSLHTKVMAFSPLGQATSQDSVQELDGKLGTSVEEDKLMKSVLESDEQNVDGQVLSDGVNRNIGAFTPDLMYSQLVNNYQMAKQIYGERIIRLLSGCSLPMLERNIRIPEFHQELLKRLRSKVENLKQKGLLDESGRISEQGATFATYLMYLEELDHLRPEGLQGTVEHKKRSHHGEKQDAKRWRPGSRFRDIDIHKTINVAIKRQRTQLDVKDLYFKERNSKGTANIIFAMDASASMKGHKIAMAKKAGIALAYKAHMRKDKIGLVVFGHEIKEALQPSENFELFLNTIGGVRATRETEFVTMLNKAIELFPDKDTIKHLIILSDALPTTGSAPEKDTLEAVSNARSHGITVSIVGIHLDKEGTKLAQDIARVGEGRMIPIRNVDSLDVEVLQEYDAAVR